MASQNKQNPITASLPPMFEQLSSFEFGKLIIELNIEQLQQLDIDRFEFVFLGGKPVLHSCRNSPKKTFEFPILTTLWHFYQYLKDMLSIKLNLQTSSNSHKQFLICEKTIQLLPVTKVMNKSYTKGNYIANSVQLCDIFCAESKQNKGYVMFKVKLDFDEELHKKVRDIVDFGEILSNPEENSDAGRYKYGALTGKAPFVQEYSVESGKAKQSQLLIDSKQVWQPTNAYANITKNIENVSMASNMQPPTVQYSQVKHLDQDESRMIEDDIDRLIQQMQSKPYDSSRYLDNGNGKQAMPQDNSRANFMHTQPMAQGSYYQSSFPSVNSIPVDSRMNRFQQDTLIQTQQTNRSQNNSRSPINQNRKYPPTPLPKNSFNDQSLQFIPGQTIYNNTQRSLSPLNSRSNRSLNRTQQSPFMQNQSMKNISYHHSNNNMAGSLINNGNSGTLKIHVHELMGRDLQSSDCFLKVYVNNQMEEIVNCKGYQEGEVIAYNQKAELNDAQLCDIEKLSFQLENYQGEILYSAVFETSRLVNIPKLQGIFMLNLIPHNQPFYGSQFTANQSVIKKMQKPPSPKNLRITVSFTQELQVIQIYLNLSKFSLNFSKCKYKIPLTKETVEFDPTQTHFNIFPHSKAYPKLIIEFWDDKSIMGVCEVGLSQLKNITKNVLECNLQPIYLYDTMMPIKNLFTQNQVGKFKLLVCCGNVRQVQHVLNKTMLSRTSSLIEMSQSSIGSKVPMEVEFDKKLGVYIKERKQQNEIEIQVDEGDFGKEERVLNQKETNPNQVSMMSENEFLAQNLQEKVEISLSKVHQINLSQQEIEDDDDQEVRQVTKKPSTEFTKKKTLSTPAEQQPKPSKKLTLLAKQSITQTPQPPPKPLSTLESIICTKIKQTFTPLFQNNLTPFRQLKKACKPSLLFNFIDIDILIKHMMELGISKFSISEILQVLQPLNGMVNFNLLNDFMMCIQVESEVKYNLCPNKLFVKMALDQYYRSSCEQVTQQQRQYNTLDKPEQTLWLSAKYLQQISTLDQSIDFNQTRKLFADLGIKISMNEYTLLKGFLQNENDIRAFLFELAESKVSYEQMVKSQKNLFEVIKLCVIEGLINRKKEQQLNQKYEQSILDKLYSSKMFQNQLNDSMSSSMHKGFESELGQSKASEYYEIKPKFVQTKKNYLSSTPQQHSDRSVLDHNESFMPSKPNTKRHFQQQDDDDFIINGLNAKPSPKVVPSSHQSKPSTERHYRADSDSDPETEQIINSHKYKQPAPQISFSNTGETVINYTTKRTITLTGLQDCKTTCECQLDMQLELPFIKVHIESPFEKKLYFKESDSSNTQSFDVRNGNNEDEEVEGTVTLSDVTKRGEIDIAAARFVVIKSIQSVYAIKTLREDTFCGLVKIIIQ